MEKQKILHGSAERSAKWADISKMENKGIAGTEAAGSKSSTHSVENFSMTNMENRENNGSFTASDASNCTIASSGATPGNANGTKDAKRPSNGSNYFDRCYSSSLLLSQLTDDDRIFSFCFYQPILNFWMGFFCYLLYGVSRKFFVT